MRKYHDLSFKIQKSSHCTYQMGDTQPTFSFAETAETGLCLLTTKIENLRMDIASHVLCSGCIPQSFSMLNTNNLPEKKIMALNSFVGPTLILDISFMFTSIKQYFNKMGILTIDLNDKEACKAYVYALDNLVLTKDILLNTLESHHLSLKNLNGLCFYTGLSKYWQYQKFEPWEHLFFLGLDFSSDLLEFIQKYKFSFLGIDSFKFGHTYFNLCGLEKIFISDPISKDYYLKRLTKLKQLPTKYVLLNSGIKLYQSLNIQQHLANKSGEFIGLPLPIEIETFDNVSLSYPIFITEN